MKLTDADVRKMSNLTDQKFREYINSFKHKGIILHDIAKKAEILKQEALISKLTAVVANYDDFIESISDMQQQLKSAGDR